MPAAALSALPPPPAAVVAAAAAARAAADAELLLRPEERGPRQHEWAMPDDCLRLCFYLLPAQDIARAAGVCRRWRRVGADELLWRRICQRTLDRYLPAPAAPAERDEAAATAGAALAVVAVPAGEALGAEAEEPAAVSLSIERQRELDALAAERRAEREERERLLAARAEVVAQFRAEARRLRSYRLAFPSLPQVFEAGLYCLRQAYTRPGVSDMFHVRADPTLRVVSHRCFWLREDGALLYSLLPGQPFEAVREMRRLMGRLATAEASRIAVEAQRAAAAAAAAAAAEAAAAAAAAVAAVAAAAAAASAGAPAPSAAAPSAAVAAAAPPPPPAAAAAAAVTGPRAAAFVPRERLLAVNTSRLGGDVERTIGKGTWRLEGRTIVAEVVTAGSILTSWRLEIEAGQPKRLVVRALTLSSPGAAPDAGHEIRELDDEAFVWQPLPVV